MDRYITAEEVIAFAASTTECGSSDIDQSIMKAWVYLGERQLGYHYGNMKVVEIVPVDGVIDKPADFKSGISFSVFDENNQELLLNYTGKTKKHILGEITSNEVYFTEDDDSYYISSNAIPYVEKAILAYYALPITETGDILIPEHHTMALIQFLRYMLAMRDINKNRAMFQEARESWLMESRRAKAKNKMPDMIKGKAIASTINSMIQKASKNNH